MFCAQCPHGTRRRRPRAERATKNAFAAKPERAKAVIAADAVDVRRKSDTGSPAAVIASKTGDYDLSMIGALGTGSRSEGLGPVASRVVEHALGPVLTGRALRGEEGVRILIAVDRSAASLHAVETVAELCDLTSAEVCLMYVAETPWIQLASEGDWATSSEEGDGKQRDWSPGERACGRRGSPDRRPRKILRHDRLLVNSRVEEGNPANEILAEAERGQYDPGRHGQSRHEAPDDGKRFFQHRLGSAMFRSDRPGTGRDRLAEGR